ncbi:MAG: hypothetical protein LBD07_03050 [Spirochaetaceae bacterium]|jgi:hypothetical protein|nr:hypothetical protein [Spirochaetaceae bacterium]
MTLGETIAAVWILRKLDAVEENTKRTDSSPPKPRLKLIAPEELDEFSDTFIGGLCLVLLGLFAACIVSFVFSAFIPAGIFGAIFVLLIRAVFFRCITRDE